MSSWPAIFNAGIDPWLKAAKSPGEFKSKSLRPNPFLRVKRSGDNP